MPWSATLCSEHDHGGAGAGRAERLVRNGHTITCPPGDPRLGFPRITPRPPAARTGATGSGGRHRARPRGSARTFAAAPGRRRGTPAPPPRPCASCTNLRPAAELAAAARLVPCHRPELTTRRPHRTGTPAPARAGRGRRYHRSRPPVVREVLDTARRVPAGAGIGSASLCSGVVDVAGPYARVLALALLLSRVADERLRAPVDHGAPTPDGTGDVAGPARAAAADTRRRDARAAGPKADQ